MYKQMAVVAAGVVGWCGASAAPAWAAAPVAGIYTESQYVVSATPKPSTVTCPQSAGQTFGGTFKYPGAGALGARAASTVISGADMWQQVCTFPMTPPAGVSTWTGTETCDFTPLAGSPAKPSVDLDFTIDLTLVDANDFLAQESVKFAVSGGTCKEERNVGFTRSGK